MLSSDEFMDLDLTQRSLLYVNVTAQNMTTKNTTCSTNLTVFIYNLISESSILFTAYAIVIHLRSVTGSDGFITCAKKPLEGESYRL
jgi:hypothetical protein